MKNAKDYQLLFFNKLKNNLGQNINLVHNIANLLNISVDAVYRRLRGDTLLNFHEIATLCEYYHIDIDDLINNKPYEVKFRHMPIQDNFVDNYKIYVTGLKNYLKNMAIDPSANKQILFAATDIPIFHLCKFPILKAFKVYTWQKLFEKSDESKFSVNDIISEDLKNVFQEISDLYDQIDSVEIWTNATLNSYLNSIRYFHEIDCFQSAQDAVAICDQLLALVEKLKEYGEKGCKEYGMKKSSFKLFLSEAELENNLIYGETENYNICFIKLYSIDAINTSDKVFCDGIKQWFDSITNKSVLISGSSQKHFFLFFKEIIGKIENLKNTLLLK
jgi:hypothetical protein